MQTKRNLRSCWRGRWRSAGSTREVTYEGPNGRPELSLFRRRARSTRTRRGTGGDATSRAGGARRPASSPATSAPPAPRR
eukprot:925567-Prorocentrum_minimum.AAC.1